MFSIQVKGNTKAQVKEVFIMELNAVIAQSHINEADRVPVEKVVDVYLDIVEDPAPDQEIDFSVSGNFSLLMTEGENKFNGAGISVSVSVIERSSAF